MKKAAVIGTIILFFLVALYEGLIIGDLNTKLRTVIGHQMDKLDKQKPVEDLQEEVKFLKNQLNLQCETEEKRVANLRKEYANSRDFCLKDLERDQSRPLSGISCFIQIRPLRGSLLRVRGRD